MPMYEGDFTVSCTQCGGQDFEEAYPVPAVVYRLYDDRGGRMREVSAAVYICSQCGHVEHFVDVEEESSSGTDAEAPGDHFDARG